MRGLATDHLSLKNPHAKHGQHQLFLELIHRSFDTLHIFNYQLASLAAVSEISDVIANVDIIHVQNIARLQLKLGNLAGPQQEFERAIARGFLLRREHMTIDHRLFGCVFMPGHGRKGRPRCQQGSDTDAKVKVLSLATAPQMAPPSVIVAAA